MKISVVIPAHNEEGNIEKCVNEVENALNNLNHEIIIVDDCSSDGTPQIADSISKKIKNVRVIHRKMSNGFGRAIRDGLSSASGDIIILLMANLSDDPKDMTKMLNKLRQGYDVVFGSRFIKGGFVRQYPKLKLVANRAFNNLIRLLFFVPYKDTTNAFKAYRSEVIRSIDIESTEFDITIELALKAMIKGYKMCEVPVSWYGRKLGSPKFGSLLNAFKCYTSCLLKLYGIFLKDKLRW